MKRSLLSDIERMAKEADEEQLRLLERTLEGDTRLGTRKAIERARRRIAAEQAERARVEAMYECAVDLARKNDGSAKLVEIVGLDEVGRGCLAGPLAVGAVVLSDDTLIEGLDDSKRLSSEKREQIARRIKESAVAWHVEFVDAQTIDDIGITGALKMAFIGAIDAVDRNLGPMRSVLIDGNPIRIDPRETTIVKGDSKCAPIAAASIVAKVERDSLMERLAEKYPEYGFDSNKGYGTDFHRQAIHDNGLTDIHRKSFCSEFLQETLF